MEDFPEHNNRWIRRGVSSFVSTRPFQVTPVIIFVSSNLKYIIFNQRPKFIGDCLIISVFRLPLPEVLGHERVEEYCFHKLYENPV